MLETGGKGQMKEALIKLINEVLAVLEIQPDKGQCWQLQDIVDDFILHINNYGRKSE